MYRGRFAPSPTGDLHLGSAACAVVGWLAARAAGGRFVLRVEDLDGPRVQPGAERRQLEDLAWLGLDWDEGPDVGGPRGPYRQSERTDLYERALAKLGRDGLTYRCDCSRADLARSASAPHAGELERPYPGTCRATGLSERAWKRPPAIRVKVSDRKVVVDDRWQGSKVEDLARTGDFVLQRGDGVHAYQLAVVVDDAAMGITEVVRGADLLESTARQLLLFELLGERAPRYAHHALVVAADGSRLAKRAASVSLRGLREAGLPPGSVLAAVALTLGLAPAEGARPEWTLAELLDEFDPARLSGRRTATVAGLPSI